MNVEERADLSTLFRSAIIAGNVRGYKLVTCQGAILSAATTNTYYLLLVSTLVAHTKNHGTHPHHCECMWLIVTLQVLKWNGFVVNILYQWEFSSLSRKEVTKIC